MIHNILTGRMRVWVDSLEMLRYSQLMHMETFGEFSGLIQPSFIIFFTIYIRTSYNQHIIGMSNTGSNQFLQSPGRQPKSITKTIPPFTQEHYQKLMQVPAENQKKCVNYLENLQPTINRAIDRQGTVLEQRYSSLFNALERANNNLTKYRSSLGNLKGSIDKSDVMMTTLMDVENYKAYSSTLLNEINKLETEINHQIKLGKTLKKVVDIKHKELNQNNYENLTILREINQLNRAIDHYQTQIKKLDGQEHIMPQIKQSALEPGDMELSAQIEQIKQQNKQLRSEILNKSNNYFEMTKLFEDSMLTFQRQLEKSQKVAASSNGLQGSMLFEMKRAQLFMTESEIITRQQYKPKSNMQAREIQSLVHDTLKQMLDNKEGKRQRYLKDFRIEWDHFKDYNGVQLLGVMSLKPKVFEELMNILEKKGKNIKQVRQSLNEFV